jgi:streptomycin 6-kinase
MTIPSTVARMILTCYGQEGQAWLDDLPAVVARLCDRWDLRVGRPFGGGCLGFVAPAERADGASLVLKVSFIDDETRHEADALSFWDGDGAVRLLERDPAWGAMLLERLQPGIALLGAEDPEEAVRIACRLLRRLWRPVPERHPFPTVTDLVDAWGRNLPLTYQQHGCPFAPSLLDRAVGLCERFSSAPSGGQVLANRDFHLGNVLSAEREPWLLIDPKPIAGEPAFDTGYLLESLLDPDPDPRRACGLCRLMANELELDPQRIADWAFVRSVENALWAADMQPDAVGTYVAAAEALLER